MRAVTFEIDPELLAKAIGLPPSATIIGCESHRSLGDRLLIDLTVSTPDVPEADAPHRTTPVITTSQPSWDWRVE